MGPFLQDYARTSLRCSGGWGLRLKGGLHLPLAASLTRGWRSVTQGGKGSFVLWFLGDRRRAARGTGGVEKDGGEARRGTRRQTEEVGGSEPATSSADFPLLPKEKRRCCRTWLASTLKSLGGTSLASRHSVVYYILFVHVLKGNEVASKPKRRLGQPRKRSKACKVRGRALR